MRENFVRLAEARTNKALKMLSIIGNLSNKSNYQYDKKDVEKIFNALQSELERNRKRFEASLGNKKNSGFKLDR
jgi:ABC-type Fe3+-hydroxamate transport system substrate-binding protein